MGMNTIFDTKCFVVTSLSTFSHTNMREQSSCRNFSAYICSLIATEKLVIIFVLESPPKVPIFSVFLKLPRFVNFKRLFLLLIRYSRSERSDRLCEI